mgnify:CR=1 FL=1
MRFPTSTYDKIARDLACRNPNMMVPWWLMASHAYYDLDDPFLSDECFDWLTKRLDELWDKTEHCHKHLLDRAALAAGTGYQLAGKMPLRIKHAARHLMHDYSDPSEIAPKPVAELDDLDELLGGPAAEELGCEHCRNDGRLIEYENMTARCPKCDAEYPDDPTPTGIDDLL